MEIHYDDTVALREWFYLKLPTWDEFKKNPNLYLIKEKNWQPRYITELVVRPDCNQSCDYCYICKHGDELYPKGERVDSNTILLNIASLLDWSLKEKRYILFTQLFAGDLFDDGLYYRVVDLFLYYYNKMDPEVFQYLKENNIHAPEITTPCNFRFANDPSKLKQLDDYVTNCKKKNGVYLGFSYSTDGPYSLNVREKCDCYDSFYGNVFSFLEKHDCGCHPMISAEGIERAIDNYKWWREVYNFYDLNGDFPPFLEVRNGGCWTPEKTKKYLEFLQFVINDRLNLCNNNIVEFSAHLFCNSEFLRRNNFYCTRDSMDPIKINYQDMFGKQMPCNLGFANTITCNNLSIIPCHRLAYPYLKGGHFEKTKDGLEIVADQNVSGYINLCAENISYSPRCFNCEIKNICMRGCKGAQFEEYGDANIPIDDVCNFLRIKAEFLITSYQSMGVFKTITESPELLANADRAKLDYCMNLLKGYSLNAG